MERRRGDVVVVVAGGRTCCLLRFQVSNSCAFISVNCRWWEWLFFVLDRRVCQPRPTCAIISLRACVNSVITRTMSELHTLKR